MAYMHIDNLYKNQQILMLRECYAMEKIHGTSARLSYSPAEFIDVTELGGEPDRVETKPSRLDFYAGGGKHEHFVKLFDAEAIKAKLDEITPNKHTIIYGEYYGGKMHEMSKTYGGEMRFVAFEVKIGGTWLNVPKAEEVVKAVGLEFVHYKKIPTTIEAIDTERDSPSMQAIRNGMGATTDKFGFCPPVQEGIVLRPLVEIALNNGERVIAKHKRDELMETKTPRSLDPEKLQKIEEAKAIADEWVTLERLSHILTSGEVEAKIENTGKIISIMVEDILREAEGEIVDSPNARKEIAKQTALLFKRHLKK